MNKELSGVSGKSGLANRVILAGISLVVVFLVGAFGFSKQLYQWELDWLTLRQKMLPVRERFDSGITLVAMDPATYDNKMRVYGADFPRVLHGYAIYFLNKSHPRSVIFDLSFNAGEDQLRPYSDRFMVEMLKGTRGYISDLMFTNREGVPWQALPRETRAGLDKNAVTVQGMDYFPQWRRAVFPSLVPPIQMLLNTPMRFYSAHGTLYEVDTLLDAADNDSLLRRWIPFTSYGGRIFPHITLGALLQDEKHLTVSRRGVLSWKGGAVNLGETGKPLIKWYGHQSKPGLLVYPEYSYWQLIESGMVLACRENPKNPDCDKFSLPPSPPLKPETFKDRHVVIGISLVNQFDNHRTIYGDRYPGFYIVANELDNLLHNDFVHPAPWWLNLLATAVLLAAGLFVFYYFQSVGTSVLAIGMLLLAYFAVTNEAYSRFNLWVNFFYPAFLLVTLFSVGYVYRYWDTEKRRQQLRYAMGKYVSPAVMMNLEKNPDDALKLGGQKRELTILFCDIRGFTTFSENNPPEKVQEMLQQYFSVMNHIITVDYEGFIDKLIGDAIMAYWGFALKDQDHPYLAVCAALAMREALEDWRQDPDKPPLNIGIGINTGEVMIGNVGSEEKMDFTMIGDAVNLASRLEGMNKEFKTNIIVSAATYAKIKDRVRARSLGMVKVRGKEEEIEIFEPLSLINPGSTVDLAMVE